MAKRSRFEFETGQQNSDLLWVSNRSGRPRYFCPVAGCLQANLINASGWGSLQGVRNHLKEHLAGRLSGAVPQAFLDAHRLCTCSVCGKIISIRFNGACPSCRPTLREAASEEAPEIPDTILPALDQICMTRTRLLRYVPKGARAAWGQAMAQAAAHVVWHNSVQAWTEWLMLPKCVLFAPPRQGKSNKRDTLAFTKLRCERWLAGERVELWRDGPGAKLDKGRNRPKTSEQDLTDKQQQRCMELAADGQYAKAIKALISSGPVARDERVEKAMRDKHPLAESPPDLTDLAEPGRDQVPEFDVFIINQMIKSFPRGTSPGPSGLRAQHLKDAVRSPHGDEALEQLTSICNLLARGDAPKPMAQYLAGASLMALEKPGGGLRPIAIGEVLRRLVAKCFCKTYEKDSHSYLWPRQIGVASPLGAEVGSQTVRQWLQCNKTSAGKVIFVADFKNAFNSVDRGKFLHEARHHLPGLSRWVEWCYGGPSKLFFDGTTLKSEVGVQQGDPLGPLLFSLALQPILVELSKITGLDFSFSFLDDLVVAGNQASVATGIEFIKQSATSLGLQLNLSKCELIPAISGGSDINWELFDESIPHQLDGCCNILGAPIGTAEYCQSITSKRAAKVQDILNAIGDLPDPQVALTLLRSCASFGKMVFSARTTPFDVHQEQLLMFDTAVRRCFEQFSGLHPDDTQWLQATLATKVGGLGLRSLSKHSPAAYLASRSSCFSLCQQLDPEHTWEVHETSSAAYKAVQYVNHHAGAEVVALHPAPQNIQQRLLSSSLDQGVLRKFNDPSQTNLSFRAHMSLLGLEGAGIWLHAIPSEALGTKIAPSLFTVMLKRRLRMPIFSEEFFCPLCDAVMDVWADHALVCSCGGDRTKRHNILRNTCVRLANSAGWRPEAEKPGLLRPRPVLGGRCEDGSMDGEGSRGPEARRPADVFVPCWDLGGSAALDFAVTSGLRLDMLEQTATDGLSCLTSYEAYKNYFMDTADQCANEGITFLPMIAEAHSGAWGPTAKKVWLKLGKAISLVSGESGALEALRAKQNLGLVLHKENARSILRRSPCVYKDTGDRVSAQTLLTTIDTYWREDDHN